MPQTGNYAMDYGPYYRPAITSTQAQKEAIGLPPLSPSELAGISYGELSSRYAESRAIRREGRAYELEQEKLDMAKRSEESTRKSNIVKGIGTMAVGGATAGAAIGAGLVGTAATATTAATSGLLGSGGAFAGGMAGATLGPIGLVLGGIAGLAFGGKD
jgi:hypothetical protein